MRPLVCFIVMMLFAAGCTSTQQQPDIKLLQQQVKETEVAFAKTMADRDHEAFKSFLAEETIFFSGPNPLRGKQTVADAWSPFYERPDAPFSWEPEQVEVLESGSLALSTGPVKTPDGKTVGTFQSIWRQESPGVWKVIFDKGCDACTCEEDE